MNSFDILRESRKNFKKLIAHLSEEQLNKVPDGFNNSIIWQLGHVVATQQLLMYALSEIDMIPSKDFIDRYRKGSGPENVADAAEIKQVLDYLTITADETETDYNSGIFTVFNRYETSFGIALESIDDALLFNNVHEAIHMGSIMALRKLV